MADLSRSATTALTVGITGSSWIAGLIASASLLSVPALARGLSEGVPTQLVAKQWQTMYDHGKALSPALAATVALGYGYLSYDNYLGKRSWLGALASGGLITAIVPYTLIVMAGTNGQLGAIADGSRKASKDEVMVLVKHWYNLNLVRSAFPLAAAAVACRSLFAES